MMEVKEVTVTAINYRHLKPEDIFKWLEKFGFLRYGERYNVDPSKRDDPRYPAERDESPPGWYTHLSIPSQYYDRTMFIIDKKQFDRLKEAYHSSLSTADHAQLTENLVDSQSDSATNSKEERR